ncbi:MAG TPA: substrate-binding domain-containing protein [Dissulfurispiraceae bacterium]|nr:substrate-binding domain-containing protein [Dissulfurispiraceae bacterium]
MENLDTLLWAMMLSALYCSITVVSLCNPLYAMEMREQVPAVTGAPVIDTPRILNWPIDGGSREPSLGEPTANLINDLHAEINQCDMVLTTAGNYHMALKDLWTIYLAKFPADSPLRNWFYTTSPPIAKQQIATGLVQFGNVRARCRPQVAVGPKELVESLVNAGFTVGDVVPLTKTRGNVLLVKKGNPKNVRTIWDLGRNDIRVITPSPSMEAGSFSLYAKSLYDIAKFDKQPPLNMSADDLFNAVFNSNDPMKWLSGKRIHHREVPWSIAFGKADAAIIFYHLALDVVTTFPDLFEFVSLGGTPAEPDPASGNHTETLYAIRIKGDWSEMQHNATEKLMELFQSNEFTDILGKRGLDRP